MVTRETQRQGYLIAPSPTALPHARIKPKLRDLQRAVPRRVVRHRLKGARLTPAARILLLGVRPHFRQMFQTAQVEVVLPRPVSRQSRDRIPI